MLIVRRSDRVRDRYRYDRRATPLGASLGLVLVVPFTIIYLVASETEVSPFFGWTIAIGLALFAFAGRFITPRRRGLKSANRRHYTGMPFDTESDEDEESAVAAPPKSD